MEVLRAQEPLAFHSRLPEWLDLIHAIDEPHIRIKRLPTHELNEDLRQFIEDLVPHAPSLLGIVGQGLADNHQHRADALEVFASNELWGSLAAEIGYGEQELEFFTSSFMQPIVHGLAGLAAKKNTEGKSVQHGLADIGVSAERSPAQKCPTCGHLPIVGILEDEPNRLGRRRLLCSLCSNAWPFPRLTCAGCLESDAEKLQNHVSETWTHVRIDACLNCSSYIKTIDSRKSGHAEPIVDELASLELDLWADEQGLRKLKRNLLGF